MSNNNGEHKRQGILYIVSAPSGAGKTSLIKALLESVPNLHVSVSHTTRERRSYEKDGADYYFIDETKFREMVKQNLFLEHAKVFDHFYGTSKQWVDEQLAAGKDIILEIDWQGARQIRELLPNTVNIFILPPSLATLQERLEERGDDKGIIARRMQEACSEIKQYREYDYLIINEEFAEALQELLHLFGATGHSYHKQGDYFDGVVRRLLG
ncbi:MAG: guanylate kinase [Gammaproteobacteria bacterium]